MGRAKDESGSAVDTLRAFGLRYPGAHTKSPWPGHLDLAVKDKTFAYLSLAGEPLTISCKLPQSAEAALSLPFTTPTAYGLGKSGWVTATFPDGTAVPVELLREWIDESYRAQAPKRMSAGLPPLGTGSGGDEPLSLESSEEDPSEADGSTVKQRATSRGGDGAQPVKRAAAKAAAAKAVVVKASVVKRAAALPLAKPQAAKRAVAPRAKRATAKAPAATSAAAKSLAAKSLAAKSPAAKSPAAKSPAAKSPAKPKSSQATASAARASAAAGTAPRRAPAQRRAAKRLSSGSVSRKRASTGKRTAVKRGPRARGAR